MTRPSTARPRSVTIGVPVHGVSAYVERCLSSLWALALPPGCTVEVIVVDDASPDDSMVKVRASIADAPPAFSVLVVTHESNLGLAEVRNTILERASGDAVWFVDSDDHVHRDMLAAMVDAMSGEVDVVVTGLVAVGESGERLPVGAMPYTGGRLWTGCDAAVELFEFRLWAFLWNKLVRRELYAGLRFPRSRSYEDTALMAVLLARARTVSFVDRELYVYSVRPGAITDGLRVDLLDLSRNVRHVVRLLEADFPLLAAHPSVSSYTARVAHLSALNHVAEHPSAGDAGRTIEREVSADVRASDVLRTVRDGHLAVAAALALIAVSPSAYVGLRRRSRLTRILRHLRRFRRV
ncbi:MULTISPECIES: glycosyltransferase family 2 protein [unclassified Rathayibacter]|uniref:glycosyltransferase family 2 protein n=1 Tax=unclassified Rathayibacter TaxID=2609250 RepID=UPI000F4B36FD|nr:MULTISPECIES: glycosyltransferase family 2 protein [unclassified Rathayibacter]ROP57744.1 glycosyltransferase involved in cell wall biosynthesis [Rathayibacter sp. PhB186]ROS56129.1 glycosyltransferase involved in cell wall biosynthesis [Rathayibacter sp. PhB185]